VLLSAKGTVEDRVRGRSLGVDAYLTKPFHPKEVLATLEGLLRSRMRILGSYMLSERIGSGGQGEVFRGEHIETGEQAAIKVVSGGNDTSSKQQLDEERRALSQLRHPNIVKVLEEGEFEDRYYVVMEHLRGQTVADIVSQRGGLSTAQVADIGFALSDALATVHDAGLVHSDIKAKNVMVIQGTSALRERVRLIDFGAVYHATHQRSSKIMGTLSYFAPEVLDGGTVSEASDVYSLGVLTYYALTGRMPFSGKDNRELTKSILENRYVPLSELLIDDVSGVAGIIERALARNPADRYPSASALRDAFRAVAPQGGAALVIATSGELDTATWAFERAS
jgi:eukaryotic-like serine/threonine-protein kinase